ncbi:hypothetical protein MRB53_039105 [Persea americana]|nr:hypothetical protein MRB53_039105 [Persea americana]
MSAVPASAHHPRGGGRGQGQGRERHQVVPARRHHPLRPRRHVLRGLLPGLCRDGAPGPGAEPPRRATPLSRRGHHRAQRRGGLLTPRCSTYTSASRALRIVLEHCTSAAALAAVRRCGPTVAATITAHHLLLTVDDWAGDPHCFCKPVAKTPGDRRALLDAVVSRDPEILLRHRLRARTPRPPNARTNSPRASSPSRTPWAWSWTRSTPRWQPARCARSRCPPAVLEGFLSGFGRRFYQLPPDAGGERIVLRRGAAAIPQSLPSADGSFEVIPFRRRQDDLARGVEVKGRGRGGGGGSGAQGVGVCMATASGEKGQGGVSRVTCQGQVSWRVGAIECRCYIQTYIHTDIIPPRI